MEIKGIRFNVVSDNGAWFLKPERNLTFDEFKSVVDIMKSHHGVYVKGGQFRFTEEPTWTVEEPTEPEVPMEIEETPMETEDTVPDEEQPEVEITTSEIDEPTEEPKETSGFTFEYNLPASIEECEEHARKVLEEIDEDDCKDHHEILLNMLVEACKTDDDLRAQFTHKEYMKVFEASGRTAFSELKKVSIGPKTLYPYILAEYKKIETKTVSKPKETARKKKTTTKTRKKKAVVV